MYCVRKTLFSIKGRKNFLNINENIFQINEI